jgi:fructose-bisphosphate aldolase, class I
VAFGAAAVCVFCVTKNYHCIAGVMNMSLGKQVHLNRMKNAQSGKMLSVAMDHGVATGYDALPRGLENVSRALPEIVAGKPDAVVFQKGMAMHCWEPYAGRIPWMMQSTIFVPHISNVDHQIGTVEEAVALGADAIAMTITVGDDRSAEMIVMLAQTVKAAERVGLPVVAHIYAKGNRVPPEQEHALNYVRYAARVGAEVGVDVCKVSYTGSSETFAEVVETCPALVVASGGPRQDTLEGFLGMIYGVMQSGAAGATMGRNVWGAPNIPAVMAALHALVHQGTDLGGALDLYHSMV